jgi:type IV pilus assembly protein PilB
MTVHFDDEKQNKKLADFRSREEEDLAQILAERYGLQYADLSGIPIDTDGLRIIPEASARTHRVAIFDLAGKRVKLAVQSPATDETKKVIEDLSNSGYELDVYVVSENSLNKAWGRYTDISFATESSAGLIEIANNELTEFVKNVKSIDEVRKALLDTIEDKKGHHTTRIVEMLLASALALGASDLHIEPEDGIIHVRMRIDGVLTPVTDVPENLYKLLLSRIKLLSSMKLNVTTTAQDGRFSIHLGDLEIEIRSSAIPGAYGESVVMRILNPDSINVSVESLGMSPELFAIMERQIERPNGMILNTGPTGSGKTTTLYAFLRKVHEPGIKIITIEDPVEYHLPGIVQTQVDHEKDYTFASGLRAALRQDPDIIMVGEIRDHETAETAVHAALTGHLVFSTLHTNNAAGTFSRLGDIGIDKNIFGSAINIAMAQRLVRKLCDACKKPTQLEGYPKELIEKVVSSIYNKEPYKDLLPPSQAWEPVGCEACNNLGYKGRIGIFEVIIVNEEIENILREGASERDIQRAAEKQGLLNLQQDGIIKILRGVTSFREIDRVIDLTTL